MRIAYLTGLTVLLLTGPVALAQDASPSEPPVAQDDSEGNKDNAAGPPDRPRRDGKRGGRGHHPRGHGHGMNRPTFADLDENADGNISIREFEAFRSARISQRKKEGRPMNRLQNPASFEEVDRNADGWVDAEEFEAHQRERQRRGVDDKGNR